MCKRKDWYRQFQYCRALLLRQFYLKDNEIDLKLREYQTLLSKRVYFLSYFDVFYNRCIVLDKNNSL